MKFIVKKASDWCYRKEVEIDSLEKLLKFCNENGEAIIIEKIEDWMKKSYDGYEYKIVIYDSYVE